MPDEGVSIADVAKSALEAVVSSAAEKVFQGLFDDGVTVTLSKEALAQIREIFKDVLKEHDYETQVTKTNTILFRVNEATRDKTVKLDPLRTDTLDNMDQIAQYGYRGTNAYLAAAGQALLVHRMIYDRASASQKEGDAKNIVELAKRILDQLLKFDDGFLDKQGLEIFTAFKRYTFGEDVYDENDTASPLSYMGKNYRENVQQLLHAIARFDDSQRELDKLKHPRYLINFFDYESIKDHVPLLWDSENCKKAWNLDQAKFWRCYPVDDYLPLGDICLRGRNTSPSRVPYIKAVGEGKLAYPQDYTLAWRDKGTHNPVDISGWLPVAPEGFVMGASVINASQEDIKPDNRCVLLPAEDVVMQTASDQIWNDKGSFANWDGSTWRYPDSAFNHTGLFIMQRTHSTPTDTWVGVIKRDALKGHPFRRTTPNAPDFDPGNWTETAGYGTSGRWAAGYKVRYRVAFYSASGQVLGPWWHPTHWPGSDAEGYYGDRWACPTVTNISIDPAGKAIGRILYRQFKGRDPEVVTVIANNTETHHLDTIDEPGYGPPASAPDFDPGNWSGGPESKNWVPGYKVRYAVSFYTAGGETPMGPWWHPTHWPGSDADGYYGDRWAYPLLTNIPIDPTNTATGRRIYRQFKGGLVELVGEIANNTDRSIADKKP